MQNLNCRVINYSLMREYNDQPSDPYEDAKPISCTLLIWVGN